MDEGTSVIDENGEDQGCKHNKGERRQCAAVMYELQQGAM